MKNILLFVAMFVLAAIAIETGWIENIMESLVGVQMYGSAQYIEPVLLMLIYLNVRKRK